MKTYALIDRQPVLALDVVPHRNRRNVLIVTTERGKQRRVRPDQIVELPDVGETFFLDDVDPDSPPVAKIVGYTRGPAALMTFRVGDVVLKTSRSSLWLETARRGGCLF